ncbi:MAG: hypothetical protein ACKVT1_07860 [Dehalococcoidia bacterium]
MEADVDLLFAETIETLAATLVALQVEHAGGDADSALIEAVRRFNNLRRSFVGSGLTAAPGGSRPSP